MAHEPHTVDTFGYPVDPELRRLEFLLGDLAAEWRGSYDQPEKQRAIVISYHQTLQQLYDLGWDAELDRESHLPEEYMPEEYIKRNVGVFDYRWSSDKTNLSRPANWKPDT